MHRFLAKYGASTREIPQTMNLNKELFLEKYLLPESWNLEYKVDERGLSVSFCEHCFAMSLGLSDEDYEFDPETNERKPNIDLREILNPTIIWAFPQPSPEYVRAYWFRKETPEERSLTFLGFAENKRDYDALLWLTEQMHSHFIDEKKKVSGTITIDDVVEKRF